MSSKWAPHSAQNFAPITSGVPHCVQNFVRLGTSEGSNVATTDSSAMAIGSVSVLARGGSAYIGMAIAMGTPCAHTRGTIRS